MLIAFAGPRLNSTRYETGSLDALYVGFGQVCPRRGVLDPHYHIRPVTRDEEKTVRAVMFEFVRAGYELVGHAEDHEGLARGAAGRCLRAQGGALPGGDARHAGHRRQPAGSRTRRPSATSSSGPCILNEYRNRGIGTELLFQSLDALREAGLSQARGRSPRATCRWRNSCTRNSIPWRAVEFEPVLAAVADSDRDGEAAAVGRAYAWTALLPRRGLDPVPVGVQHSGPKKSR